MIVVDSSALVDFLLGYEPEAGWVESWLLAEPEVHAPHVIDVEVTGAVRRAVLGGAVTAADGAAAVAELPGIVEFRYSHVPLLDVMWRLRANLTAADAAFVALAELIEAPLVTTDVRLSRAPGVRAEVVAFRA